VLDPGGEGAGDDTQREPRQEGQDVAAPRKFCVTPPQDHEKRGGEGGGHCLGQQRAGKPKGGDPVGTAPALIVKPQESECGAEIENGRKGVFLLRDPGHGLNGDGMQREQQCGEPHAGDPEASQDGSDEAGRGRVQEDVDQMIAGRPVAPQAVLDPECRVQQRIVLLGSADVGPDARKTGHGLKFGLCDVPGFVVPDEIGRERGKVCDEGGEENQHADPAGAGRLCFSRRDGAFVRGRLQSRMKER
jgi:hypothetical protein